MAEPNYEQMLSKFKTLLNMPGGSIAEGSKDNRNSVGTGSTQNWVTRPGQVYLEPDADDAKDFGKGAVHFTGRERSADYILYAQRDVNDHESAGRVTFNYEFTRRGNVYVSDVAKHGGRGRCGNAVVRHIQALDEDNVNAA